MPWYVAVLVVVILTLAFGYLVLGVSDQRGLVVMGTAAALMTAGAYAIKYGLSGARSIADAAGGEDEDIFEKNIEKGVEEMVGSGEDHKTTDERSLHRMFGESTKDPDRFASKYESLSTEDQIRTKFLLTQLGENTLLKAVHAL